MALPIEDYALIGDRRTAALVGRDGSIDWLCLPQFDSPACLAGLLGTDDHGHWQLVPDGIWTSTRRYLGASSVLETTFTTATGEVTLADLMPRGDGRADVVRKLSGVRGTVRMRHEWRVRLDYGLMKPWVRRLTVDGERVITAIGGPDQLVLRGPRLPVARDGSHNDEFDVHEGDELVFSMTWFPSYVQPEGLGPAADQVLPTVADDEAWLAGSPRDVPHADVVARSLLTLRLMTDEVTGGIVAAPTTSLPEDFGGERNWDYRFCWLRDAALTLGSLVDAGYTEEADLWRQWLLRTIAGDPAQMQIMYAVDGSRRLPETTLDHLPGYADSRPVRIGNGAVDQVQHDVLGEVMEALAKMREAEGSGGHPDHSWPLQRALVEELATHWRDPDNGLWEIRGEPQQFTHSRVMIWVAVDRAVRAMEEFDLPGPLTQWRELREDIRADVLEHGFDAERGCFTQHYATTEVDASLLQLALVGFLEPDDPRLLGTVRVVEEELLRNGLVLRYRTKSGVDGLSGDEHPFLACSFWLVSAYAVIGRVDDAVALFDRLVGLVNDVGLLSEEYDPVGQRMVGNFPQAFSHLALVQAALRLRDAGVRG
ncbi:glycoside hydrolase family 15 protein [Nocardioides flavescens]|uniref:Glycoside hydrolase family 15 protein n=1 Tax=Nocardioides flavescens TaxID=2691959 RepID=A0A6L7EXM4_9ACTN|nr:glycoside hydrolase family 15 protein [Nocardioides flavescens]MXG90616.1 glycoside hydrolase family 15 protein [Nocardioides flavescens]